MGKKNEEFEDLSIDLDDDNLEDFEEDEEVSPEPRKKRASDASEDLDEDDFEEPARKPRKKKKAKAAAPSKRKNTVAAVVIGALVVLGSAGFVYMTMSPSPRATSMSPFGNNPAPAPVAQAPVVPQTALTQPQVPANQGLGAPAPMPVAPTPAPRQDSAVMAESSASALAGGEVSLEHEKIQEATREAVAAATRDLSNQVLSMGVQIADLQHRLAESANRSSCDTDEIVAELRRKMKEDEAAKAAAVKKEPRKTAKKVVKAPAPKPKATAKWKVLGLSADRAVIVNGKGEQLVVSVGDKVEGVKIEKIDPARGVVETSEGLVK
jgi:hypothetical protein